MVLPIIYYPDPLLRQKSETITHINNNIITLARNMEDTVQHHNGAGLAAIQVGSPVRLFITCESGERKDIKHYINPVITVSSCDEFFQHNPKLATNDEHCYPCEQQKHNHLKQPENILLEEGCLSIPGEWGHVMRPEYVSITAQNLEGKTFTIYAGGFLARILQHEHDHLDGILFLQRLEHSRREKIIKSIKKRAKEDDYPIPKDTTNNASNKPKH